MQEQLSLHNDKLVGRALERVEDPALLTGRGRFADDLGTRPGTAHAAVLRSPHAHAEIVSVDISAALAEPGVRAVLTGEDLATWSRPFISGVKQPMEQWAVACDRVRYAGEPVAVVVAEDRYLAEDALEQIEVVYKPLPVVVNPQAAASEGAPLLHDAVGSNVVSERHFHYGDTQAAFDRAPHRIGLDVRYPRNACTPIEAYVVVAEYEPGENAYDVLANFQGPFTLHPVMARALDVPGNRLRLRTPPDSGGSFGVKQAVFPYIVAMCLAARKARCPVKWVEDRLEHLAAATSATNRVSHIEAAVADDGEILALRYDQLDDCGAYLRAPEPASLYRMHGHMTGAYEVQNLSVTNRVVLTNKTPSGLNRGFGGPQVYFALERLMQKIAQTLNLDPLAVVQRNLIPANALPYRTPSGSLLDSGNYPHAVASAAEDGKLDELRRRRDEARAAGKRYGIGFACVVEPSISNMGYITTALTAEERERAGPKDGAPSVATVAMDPLGAVTVTVASTPQGQGHRTVLAQVVGDALGLPIEDIRVNVEHDTAKDPWSIAAGNYSSRFAGAVAGTAHLAATRLRARLARLASPVLNVAEHALEFAGGQVFATGNPDNAMPLRRLAGAGHWSAASLPEGEPPGLHETVFWSMPELTPPDAGDRVNSSGVYGFIFDFCGVEIDADSGHVRIDRYVTMHDAGTRLNPALVDGQIRGGFAHAVGAALYEELAYAEDGSFLAGTFADYPVPTACEIPEPHILHVESASPFTPLGAKGVGEGNCMSTPVCIANAVADALGVEDVELPLIPSRVAALIHGDESPPPDDPGEHLGSDKIPPSTRPAGGTLSGEGEATVSGTPEGVWKTLQDPQALRRVVPGCQSIQTLGNDRYRAELRVGVGPVRGRFVTEFSYIDLEPPRSLRFRADASGPLGSGTADGRVHLGVHPDGTRVRYRYDAQFGGKIAAVGARLLDGTARKLIGEIFARLGDPPPADEAPASSLLRRFLDWLGLDR